MMDSVATKNLVTQMGKMPILIRDAFYWDKFYMFVTGVREIEDDSGNSVKLSSKLFDNPKNREQNDFDEVLRKIIQKVFLAS